MFNNQAIDDVSEGARSLLYTVKQLDRTIAHIAILNPKATKAPIATLLHKSPISLIVPISLLTLKRSIRLLRPFGLLGLIVPENPTLVLIDTTEKIDTTPPQLPRAAGVHFCGSQY
ncbi:hypothetical protein F8M41_007679 [Gigaspora margarita]|uniref:Uncharacterized protein n=1 Tax=Gigaspora margarita TaxID=4874 RepID=A0A8H3X6G5_GIGMA|nr:hypothetical protein F8M41_007679 [Gigaspora margarita]